MLNQQIESLVWECAETNVPRDSENLFEALYGVEVFFNFKTGPSGKPELTTYKVGPLQHVIKFYTAKTNPKLTKPFAGIQWDSALRLFIKIPTADGLLLANESDSYVTFGRRAIQSAIENHNRAKK